MSSIPPNRGSRGYLLPPGLKDLIDGLSDPATNLRYDALRLNDQIHADKVRVVGEQREQLGVMSRSDALDLARSKGMDLVELAPHAAPPVCRLLDYGAFCDALSKLGKTKSNDVE